MPELPDIELYLERLKSRIAGKVLRRLRIASPFLLRTVSPAPAEFEGSRVLGLRRIGKRIVWEFERDRFVVLHLMIAGRLRWKDAGVEIPAKLGLAAFDFETGTALLTEAGTKKRASLHLVVGEAALRALDPGGIEPLEATLDEFRAALTRESHTLKRALTDPRLFSGIGNAYSDEILHRARLSPARRTGQLSAEETARLHEATCDVLRQWLERLRNEHPEDAFPDKVTAFKEGMAVHGRFGRPCPACGAPVQRIVYAANESNYCATCQTDGKLLADRAMSRLLRKDWPRTLEELELRRRSDS